MELKKWIERWNYLGIPAYETEIGVEFRNRKFPPKIKSEPNFIYINITETDLFCLDIEGVPGSVEEFEFYLNSKGVLLNDLFYERTRNGGYHIYFRDHNKLRRNNFGQRIGRILYDSLSVGRVFTSPSEFKNKKYTFGNKTPFDIESINEIPIIPNWVISDFEK